MARNILPLNMKCSCTLVSDGDLGIQSANSMVPMQVWSRSILTVIRFNQSLWTNRLESHCTNYTSIPCHPWNLNLLQWSATAINAPIVTTSFGKPSKPTRFRYLMAPFTSCIRMQKREIVKQEWDWTGYLTSLEGAAVDLLNEFSVVSNMSLLHLHEEHFDLLD